MHPDTQVKSGTIVYIDVGHARLECIYRWPSATLIGFHCVSLKPGDERLAHIPAARIEAGPQCGHSVCSQHYIDTADNECIDPCEECDLPMGDHSSRERRQCANALKFEQECPSSLQEYEDDKKGDYLR